MSPTKQTFLCSICNKTAQLLVDSKSLNVINTCVATEGCVGTLVPTNTKQLDSGFIQRPLRSVLSTREQSAPSSRWIHVHNLNCYPTVVVESTNNQYVVEYTDLNTVTLIFPVQTTGKSQCIRTSASTITENQKSDLVTVAPHGICTFAYDSDADLSVDVTFNGTVYTVAASDPVLQSCWSDLSTVNILWNKQLVKNILLSDLPFYSKLVTGDVIEINGRFSWILLTTSPHLNTIDKNPNIVIPNYSPVTLLFSNGAFSCIDSEIENIFPPITNG